MIGIGLSPRAARKVPFVPTNLATPCVGWWRADRGITLNGGNVSQINDGSGLARHIAQAVAAKQPPWNASGGPGNQAYIGTFDHVIPQYLTGAWTQAQPIELWTVALPSVADRGVGTIHDGAGGGNNMRRYVTGAPASSIYAGASLNNEGDDTNQWRRRIDLFNGANSMNRVGAAEVNGNAGTNAAAGMTLGIYGDGSTANDPSDMRWCESIMYSAALTPSERLVLDDYIAARYGL